MPVIPHEPTRTRILDSARVFVRHITQIWAPTLSKITKRLALPQTSQDGSPSDGIVAIPTVYQGLNSGPAPGAVVGIVLGSVAGFLLLIWLLWTLSNGNGFIRTSQLEEEDVYISRGSRSRRSQPQAEMTSRSPVRRERVIRQERIVRDIPLPREPSRIRETIILESPRSERRVEGDDIVEVIEEHSSVSNDPPPKRKSRRSSGYRRSEYTDR